MVSDWVGYSVVVQGFQTNILALVPPVKSNSLFGVAQGLVILQHISQSRLLLTSMLSCCLGQLGDDVHMVVATSQY